MDLLSSAIGEEQEIERQNADELCTSNLHARVTIKYMPEADNDEQIANGSTALPILDGCNANSTCSLSNKNRQQEYAAMKLCLKDSTSKLQVYGSTNHSSKNTTTDIDILRLEEKIKQVEEKIRFATNKRLKERQHSLQHLDNHNNALHTIKHLQAYVVDKLNDMAEKKDTTASMPPTLSFLDINEKVDSSLNTILKSSTSLQKLKADYTSALMELERNVERLPHRHTALKRHKKRVNKLKVILHKLSAAIKR